MVQAGPLKLQGLPEFGKLEVCVEQCLPALTSELHPSADPCEQSRVLLTVAPAGEGAFVSVSGEAADICS